MNKIKYNPLSGMMQLFESNKVLRKILFFVIDIGFEDFVFRTINKNFLKQRKEFYMKRKSEVEENINILADDKSKEI